MGTCFRLLCAIAMLMPAIVHAQTFDQPRGNYPSGENPANGAVGNRPPSSPDAARPLPAPGTAPTAPEPAAPPSQAGAPVPSPAPPPAAPPVPAAPPAQAARPVPPAPAVPPPPAAAPAAPPALSASPSSVSSGGSAVVMVPEGARRIAPRVSLPATRAPARNKRHVGKTRAAPPAEQAGPARQGDAVSGAGR